jgi:hypothetical protein
MKEIRSEKVNTNNAWGFGGMVGTVTEYDNGMIQRKGRAFFRHLPPEPVNRWQVRLFEDFVIDIDGAKPEHGTVYVYEAEESYRAYFVKRTWPFPFEDMNEKAVLFKTIEF